jgi:uncharacterized alpha-E superfamily protein
LSSRVADDLFWLGRYVERAEGLARLLRGIFARLAGEAGLAGVPELPALTDALAAYARVDEGFAGEDAAALEAALRSFVLAESPPRTLRATLASGQRLGAVVRDQISLDTWRVLSQIESGLERLAQHGDPPLGDILDVLSGLILSCAAFSGLGNESMTRGQGWRFIDIGRRIERVQYTIRLLQHTLGTQADDADAVLEALLEVADSSMTYRRRYLGALETPPALDLLLTDETNPRSASISWSCWTTTCARWAAARTARKAPSTPLARPAERLAGPPPMRRRRGVVEHLSQLADDIRPRDTLARQYLSHAAAALVGGR